MSPDLSSLLISLVSARLLAAKSLEAQGRIHWARPLGAKSACITFALLRASYTSTLRPSGR